MAAIPDDILAVLKAEEIPETTDIYKFIKELPRLDVSDDSAQAWAIHVLNTLRKPEPEAKPSIPTPNAKS